ncbi:MAG: von Willebrand factor type A domain-containing protein, partial [Acidobacteria bacterium]|nr:von Willebrand factor type A domain-containing protein [Acidobacteriota bacterium]
MRPACRSASYSNVRRFLNEGRLPPPDAVRTEELINREASGAVGQAGRQHLQVVPGRIVRRHPVPAGTLGLIERLVSAMDACDRIAFSGNGRRNA